MKDSAARDENCLNTSAASKLNAGPFPPLGPVSRSEADATRDGRIGDAVETRAHRAEHPGRRRMPAEGIPGHLAARPCPSGAASPVRGERSTKRNPGHPRNRLTVNERKIQRELLRSFLSGA